MSCISRKNLRDRVQGGALTGLRVKLAATSMFPTAADLFGRHRSVECATNSFGTPRRFSSCSKNNDMSILQNMEILKGNKEIYFDVSRWQLLIRHCPVFCTVYLISCDIRERSIIRPK